VTGCQRAGEAGADGIEALLFLLVILWPAEGLPSKESGAVVVGPGLGEGQLPADVIRIESGGLHQTDDEKGLPEGAGYFPRLALPVPSVTSSTSFTWAAL